MKTSSANDLIVEILDDKALSQLDAGQWDALAANALDSNPFYARAYVLAGIETVDRASGLRAVAIWSADCERLLGLFPYRNKTLPLPSAVAATNLYQVCGQPLIHREEADAVIAAWLGATRSGQAPRRWSFPHLDLTSHFARRLAVLQSDTSVRCLPLPQYRRARLARLSRSFKEHLGSAVAKSRVKDIERNLRRLRDLGDLQFERATDSALVTKRIEQFLAVEHSGWKGKAGTSFLSDPQHARFARKAFCPHLGQTSVDSLLLDGTPIALSVNIRAGATLFTPKCAYDEAYRKYGPGLALEHLVVEAFYADEDCTEMDSATTTDGHVIQGFWNSDAPMGTLVVGPPNWGTDLIAKAHTANRLTRQRLKTLNTGAASQVLGLARSWHKRAQRFAGDMLMGGVCFIHTLENALPHLI